MGAKVSRLSDYRNRTARGCVQGKTPADQIPHTARIMANGDQLYHDLVYMSAQKEDGSYDFHENYEYVKPWLQKADLALGDFEGTINPNYYLSGYPLFNAPSEVVPAIKDAGYDVMDLGHNHILDSGLEGVYSTAKAFEDAGITPVGVYTHEKRAKPLGDQGSEWHQDCYSSLCLRL